MADDTQTLKMIEELQERLNLLEAEVARLRKSERSTGGARSAAPNDRAKEVLSPSAFERPQIFPPTTQDDAESIVGGRPTSDFEDCCAVGNDEGFYCTGTLIAPNIVVTAGHCTGVTRVFAKGGDINHPEDGEIIAVKNTIQHSTADFRVLVLDGNSTVKPRHVAQGSEINNPTKARLVGFGNVNLAGTIGYGIKRMVDVPIVSLSCSAPDAQQEYGCRDKEMVAGHRGLLKDSCHGDSGGPLYIKNAEGSYSLLGATSRGLQHSEHPCGDGGIYVRVDQFLDWIKEQTGVAIEDF